MKLQIKAVVMMTVLFIGVMSQTACPTDSSIHKAASASYQLAGLTRDVITAVGRAYDEHIITAEQKNTIADKLGKISAGGSRLNAMISSYDRSTTGITPTQLSLVNSLLSSDIAGPFLDIVTLIGGLSASQATYLHTALGALRTAILLISSVVAQDIHDDVARRSLAYG